MSYTREQLLQAHASARVYQERYDHSFQPWGMRAPEPVVGEPVDDYRRNSRSRPSGFCPTDISSAKFNSASYETMLSRSSSRNFCRTSSPRLIEPTLFRWKDHCAASKRSIKTE